jgi:hypothetical protein
MWKDSGRPVACRLAASLNQLEGTNLAENETLTVGGSTASRWRGVQQRLSSGEAVSECFCDIEEQFYRGLRGASKQWARRGVTLEQMLTTAMDAPERLAELVRQVRNQDHARLLLDVVRRQRFLLLEELVAAWLRAVWESIRDQLQLDIADQADAPAVEERVRAMLRRLARLIARNPCPRAAAEAVPNLTRSLL